MPAGTDAPLSQTELDAMQLHASAIWEREPGTTMVIGSGPVASCIAAALGTGCMAIETFHAAVPTTPSGGYPQCLESVHRVVVVLANEAHASEVIRDVGRIWYWLEKLTSAGDQHEAGFIFVLCGNATSAFQFELAVGVGVDLSKAEQQGHGFWHPSQRLAELLDLLVRVVPTDSVLMKAKRASDVRRASLAALLRATDDGDDRRIEAAAEDVKAAFRGSEHLLDLFCRPPSHRHGNLLRRWLEVPVVAHRERLCESVEGTVPRDWLALEGITET